MEIGLGLLLQISIKKTRNVTVILRQVERKVQWIFMILIQMLGVEIAQKKGETVIPRRPQVPLQNDLLVPGSFGKRKRVQMLIM